MRSLSRTYRLVALVTGFLILAGISSPSAIYAWSAHCDMQTDVSVADHHRHDRASVPHAEQDDTEACHTGISCECCTTQSVINTQSTNPLIRTNADLESVVSETVASPANRAIAAIAPDLHRAAEIGSPPIFLMNSAFLN